jgi:hypothetical protein
MGIPINAAHSHLPNLLEGILEISSSNALNFRFPCDWGFQEAQQELIELGASKDFVTDTWIRTHYRWIVWKLACTLRSYCHLMNDFPSNCRGLDENSSGVSLGIDLTKKLRHEPATKLSLDLSPSAVMHQLRYRYEREYVRGQRSCIRLILEKDDTSCRPMILCVVAIVSFGSSPGSTKMLELTDGWYSIYALLDTVLLRGVNRGSIKVGSKLAISSAALVGASHAGTSGASVTPAPLQTQETFTTFPSTYLRLNANSVRLAMFHAKLGYSSPSHPFGLSLRAVSCDGGVIPQISVQIIRRYPVNYYELSITGERNYYNEREYTHTVAIRERKKEEAGLERTISFPSLCAMSDADLALLVNTLGIENILSKISAPERSLIKNRIENLSKMNFPMDEAPSKCNVTPFFRMKVACIRGLDLANPTKSNTNAKIGLTTATLSLWRPSDSHLSEIKEGRCFEVG